MTTHAQLNPVIVVLSPTTAEERSAVECPEHGRVARTADRSVGAGLTGVVAAQTQVGTTVVVVLRQTGTGTQS